MLSKITYVVTRQNSPYNYAENIISIYRNLIKMNFDCIWDLQQPFSFRARPQPRFMLLGKALRRKVHLAHTKKASAKHRPSKDLAHLLLEEVGSSLQTITLYQVSCLVTYPTLQALQLHPTLRSSELWNCFSGPWWCCANTLWNLEKKKAA